MGLERINAGYAALGVDSGDVPSEQSTIVHGVALGEGDTTIGGSGKQTYWPADVLKEAAEGLQGQPLATDMNHTADDPKQQTPVDAVVGEVTWSGYAPGIGVLYEAELDDESLAEKVANGRLEVSPLVARDLEPREQGDAEYEATEIHRWRDLALVVNGAAPSNEITVGDNPMKAEALHAAVESLQDVDLVPPEQAAENARRGLECVEEVDTDAGEAKGREIARQIIDAVENNNELSPETVSDIASFDRHREQGNHTIDEEHEGTPCEDNGYVSWNLWGGSAGVDWAQEKNNQMESMALVALKEVAGVEFDGTSTGKLDESEIPTEGYKSHYLYPADTKSESAYPVVDADGNLRRGNVDAAWSLGARDGRDEEEHDSRLLELAAEFENPPEWASETEAMAEFDDLSDDDLVEWDSSGGMAQGRIVDLRDEGEPDYDDEIDGDVTVSPPAALIEIVGMDDGEVVGQDTMVAHKPDTLTVIDESDIEAMSKHGDMDENMADVPDEFVFDNPGEAVEKAQEMGLDGPSDEIIHSHGEGDSTVFMPGATHSDLMDMIDADEESADEAMWSDDPVWASSTAADSDTTNSKSTMNETEEAILSAAESVEEPIEALEAHAAAEEPTVVEQDTYESMRNTLADALKDKTGLKDETVEAMSFNALVGEFEDDEGNLKAEALTQTPETEQPDPDGEEALSDDTREKAEALMADYDAGFTAVESDLCDTLDVESVSEAREVLN